MAVTDLQVATLRALLVRDFVEYERLIDQLGDSGMRNGYVPLLTGAFFEAVKHRFNRRPRSEIIEWIAQVRAERDANEQIDPEVAERLIFWVFGRATTDGIDFNTSYGHQTMLLGMLVDEQGLDDQGLTDFLQRARKFANEIAD